MRWRELHYIEESFMFLGVPSLGWCSGIRDATAKRQSDCIYFGNYFTDEVQHATILLQYFGWIFVVSQ